MAAIVAKAKGSADSGGAASDDKGNAQILLSHLDPKKS